MGRPGFQGETLGNGMRIPEAEFTFLKKGSKVFEGGGPQVFIDPSPFHSSPYVNGSYLLLTMRQTVKPIRPPATSAQEMGVWKCGMLKAVAPILLPPTTRASNQSAAMVARSATRNLPMFVCSSCLSFGRFVNGSAACFRSCLLCVCRCGAFVRRFS